MSLRNSLANKKRMKVNSTVGSTSYLGSSSDVVESNNSSGNSVQQEDCSIPLSKKIKGRLSNDMDDSFDLFVLKKVPLKAVSPVKKDVSVPSPVKKKEINQKLEGTNNLKKSPKREVVKKCYYFNEDPKPLVSLPCPFCFKLYENISVHLKTSCIYRNVVNDETLSVLLQIHSDYWNQRKKFGLPDLHFNEGEVFKTNTARKCHCKTDLNFFGSKGSTSKWSKAKLNKYLLLRLSQSERLNIINKKMEILLATDKKEENNGTHFKTFEKIFYSHFLEHLLFKGLSFWNKSHLKPDEVTDSTFYIKAFAPLIAPIKKNVEQDLPLFEVENEPDNDSAISPVKHQWKEDNMMKDCIPCLEENIVSPTKDSCFTETNSLEFSSLKNTETQSYCESTLSKDWEKLFYSSDFSDTTILFNDGSFLGHRLVFWVRAIKLFRSISTSSVHNYGKLLDLKDVSSKVGKAFIKYIYSGKTNHFLDMIEKDLNCIQLLCKKYDQFDLDDFICKIKKSNEKDVSSKTKGTSFVSGHRNLTSPDMFDDVDMYDSPVNFDSSIKYKDTTSGKRKLELTSNELSEDESFKRLKKNNDDILHSIDTIVSKNSCFESCTDVIHISSGTSVNSRSYEHLTNRPLSQCSTLPPLSVSPVEKEDEDLDLTQSPPSPINSIIEINRDSVEECFVETESNMYASINHETIIYNDTLDYNIYEDLPYNNGMKYEDKSKYGMIKSSILKNVAVPSPTQNSLEKYFNESISSNFFERSESSDRSPQPSDKTLQGSPICQSTPTRAKTSEINFTTPSPQIIVSDQVTPLLNYSNLISPELKVELRKYGLKPDMDRKKAKTLLKYIYELVHPVIPPPNEGKDELISDQIENECKLNMGEEENLNLTLNKDKRIDIPESRVNTSSESLLLRDDDCGNGIDFDFEYYDKCDAVNSQESSSYLTKNDLMKSISIFIKKDAILFESIVQYVPVCFSKFHKALKENGVLCTANDLMDALDELCVAFRTERRLKENKSKS